MSITITNTYGTPHNVSETNPTHVTSCDRYRLPLVGTIAPGTPGYEDMVEMLRENDHHTREGYGLIFLESEEFSAIYFGSIEQIEQYKRDNADGPATFDPSQGVTYAKWPHGKGWDDYIPRTFWNVQARGGIADGVGLVTAFAHTEIQGAEVVVYEFEARGAAAASRSRWSPTTAPPATSTPSTTAGTCTRTPAPAAAAGPPARPASTSPAPTGTASAPPTAPAAPATARSCAPSTR